MGLPYQMLNRLQQAAIEAEQERSQYPSGLIPMTHQQGAEVLSTIRHTPTPPRPRLPLRTMTSDEGAVILQRIISPPQSDTKPHFETPQPSSLTSILQRLFK